MVHLQHFIISQRDSLTLRPPLLLFSHLTYLKSKAQRMIPHCSSPCWVKTSWTPCYVFSVTHRWTKARRSLLIPSLCVDSALLCCCGQYSFSTQWGGEVSMDVSPAKREKSLRLSSWRCQTHATFLRARWRGFSFQRSDFTCSFSTFMNSASLRSPHHSPFAFGNRASGKWKSTHMWTGN